MGSKILVMVVSYDGFCRQLLGSLLNKNGYETIFFADTGQLPDTLYRSIPDLVIIAAKDNTAPACRVVSAHPDIGRTPIIVLSELSGGPDRDEAFSAGCADYVIAPFGETEILARIDIHLENKRLHKWLKEKITEQTKELTEVQMETIIAMAEVAESRDTLTVLHLDRIRRYCRVLAKKLAETARFHREITQEFTDIIYHASALHDIGKIGVRDGILNKYGKLTNEEFEIVASHTTKGAIAFESVVENHPNSSFIRMSVEIIKFHHERWNGKGYPLKISGETIPLSARIMALADVYDAVRSKRSYKEAKTHEEAVNEILVMKGTYLDPSVVEAFVGAQNEFIQIYEKISRG